MPVAVEIVHLPTSEAFRNDHSFFDPVLKYVSSANGNLGTYYGFLEEDPNEAYMAVVWETVEHHRAMMSDPEVYPKLLEAVKDCIIAPIKMYHILLEPTSAVSAALNSPITSFDHITELAEGATHDNGLVNLSKTFGAPREGVPLAFGKALESNEFTVIRGWDSSLLRLGRTKGLEAANRERAGNEVESANLRVVKTVHTKLSAYKRYQG